MLGKLIKYEMKSSARYLLPLYVSVLILAVVNRLGALWLQNMPGSSTWEGLLMFFYVLLSISLFVVTGVGILVRFYHNLLGQEGYLMFTLPVSTSANLFAKLISAIFWIIASMLVFFLSVLLLTFSSTWQISDIIDWVSRTFSGFELGAVFVLLEICLLVLLSLASFVLLCYLSMSIGQLANRQKLLLSVAAFLALQVVISTLSVIFLSHNAAWLSTSISAWIDSMSPQAAIHGVLLGSCLGALVECAILYIPCWLLLKNKLNLS
ncbi:MAG: hypothetical protein K6B40_04090 [Firmicutes bacterium]|nr:hypothetical protein [Bacillota bacterium]